MPAGTNASQGRTPYGPPFLSSCFEDASALHPDESALALLGVVTREQLDEFVFVDPYLLDRPVREIEHDVEDFQLVVRRSGGRPWAGVEPKAARTRGRITRCREDRLAGLEIRVFNGRRVVVVDA